MTNRDFKIEDCRPFDLEQAKDGMPFCRRDGKSVRHFIYDMKTAGKHYPLVGVTECYSAPQAGEEVQYWSLDGTNMHSTPLDLVMTPICYKDGKPVNIGDKLIDDLGREMTVHEEAVDYVPYIQNHCKWAVTD